MSESILPVKPRLCARVESGAAGQVELHTPTDVLDVEPPEGVGTEAFRGLLERLDGAATLPELAADTGIETDTVARILAPAVAWGLIEDGAEPEAGSGPAALSRLEDVLNRLLEDLVFAGPFWRTLLTEPEALPPNVYYGFGLENWFFLFRENEFDSAVLALPESAEVRGMLNDFYHEEHRHDDVVVRAFAYLGIGREDLLRARPLPTTTALIKMLSWWARTDPLFFLATIGVLEGRLDPDGDGSDGKVAYDSFIAACDKVGLAAEFVEPLRAHARLNAGHDHGAVSRELFACVPGVDADTESRWHAKAHLFMETYAAFFNGIASYYRDPARPLLRTSEL
ncbi:hypothetical protein Acsp04_63060 [Actinomadura sp. NBRC 104425]|uniref:hypothetical protein n=1 Tax=Actinomadura sp. NBRC 104425 TaxID=3032204 RepID=UPI0024A5FC42|nr:hypothetical protein [Actinomadura sp. NBRC 104425]GLZ16071.1 hypothetical protein Acsp04_63060 [Actinomadura sp. NBRC 104425]